MKSTQKEIDAVIKLPGHQRYNFFVKRVADWEEAWGLYEEGWALARTEDGALIFPIWPGHSYAYICANEEWKNYKPKSIPLNDLIKELLPNLDNDKVSLGVFYTPEERGVIISPKNLITDLEEESKLYD